MALKTANLPQIEINTWRLKTKCKIITDQFIGNNCNKIVYNDIDTDSTTEIPRIRANKKPFKKRIKATTLNLTRLLLWSIYLKLTRRANQLRRAVAYFDVFRIASANYIPKITGAFGHSGWGPQALLIEIV